MMNYSVMLQGTSSSVGKSVLAAALCRLFYRAGYRVAPFKSQNMALNSCVTRDGGEMGRAQVLQAYAAGVEPSVRMNPILLKPTAPASSQIVVLGSPVGNLSAMEYHGNYNQSLLGVVEGAYTSLCREFEIIVIEGAGSPAEVNLKKHEIANMRIARMTGAPVLLVADIDRGGALAAVVGTLELLDPDEREMVSGIIINKFRGDLALLRPALEFLEARTGKPVLGVIPYLPDLGLPEEDSVALERKINRASTAEQIEIAVVTTPRISNFTDFDPLEREPGVNVRYVAGKEPLGKPDLVILPGSKNTLSDLLFLEECGKVAEIKRLAAAGVPVIGICGGYQMLGIEINDPEGSEGGGARRVKGMGLLDIVTDFALTKATYLVEANITGDGPFLGPCRGWQVRGYEIHMGESRRVNRTEAAFRIKKRGEEPAEVDDGAVAPGGLILGTYMHGIFDNDNFRGNVLSFLRRRRGLADRQGDYKFAADLEKRLDELARVVGASLDLERLAEIMGLSRPLEVVDFVS
ncbi:cobyric acid synthase [Pelotomaculum terephthalicicum JT]|uniref:cobyric acid synthase n=1 Tax=Pelotomaculum TaxID=191373 RepID=UPI001F048A2C|nr:MULTISPECIES: cobyric acid synthase [Pelotomaculum]MCG9967322.1 cobyric acid synthase [Pelotomaculum terephthalicicum JT]